MREITTHRIGRLNECIKLETEDVAGPGGANFLYKIGGIEGPIDNNPIPATEIRFQNGELDDVGANGLSNEVLLAIVIDRLEGFQRGQFKCRENALVITKLEEAMLWLTHRVIKLQRLGERA